MADPRKVPFVTLASFNTGPAPDSKKRRREDEENEPSSGVTGGSLFGAGKTEKDSAESKPTVRLTLSLSEPSEQKSAEFNYTELIHTNVQGRKVPEGLTPAVDPRDPLANQDREKQEVEALARKFESKYGNNGKKKRRDRMQDLIDIGYGYDETDPFIDNSEAYDELVPASLNTKLGGFYINTGTLQFRAASDSEDGAHNTHHKKDAEDRVIKRRKKKQDGGLDEKKPKKFKVPRPGVMALNRPDKKKRKKLMKDSLSLAAMIRRFTREKEIRKKNSLVTGKVVRVQPNPSAPTGDLSVADLTSDPALMSLLGGGSENDVLQELMGDLDFGMLDSPQLHSPGPSENGVPAALKTGLPGRVTKTGVVPQPPLPSGLPPPLLKRIEDLRVASRQFDMEGRKKFFTLDMNNILLDIELQVREQGAGVRAAVYSHLEAFVPCNRDALLKRLRKLSLHVQDERLQTPLLKLKLAVCAVMPEQIARYNMGCMTKVKLQAEEGDRNGSEDDDEEKPGRRVTGPRKKFAWDDKTRDLLCELVREKLGCYALEGQGSLSPEDYLKVFMETEVKVLWPKGWMQTRILIKESRTAHNHLTGNTVKKRIIPAPKPKPRPQDDAVNATPPPAPGVPRAPSPPEPICLSDSLDEDLTAPSLDSISEALALLSSAAKGLVPSGTPPPSEKAPGPQHASPLLAKKPASALSPSPSIKAFTTLPPPQRHTLVPAQRPAVTLVNKMGVPTPPPPSKPRPPATASPLHVPQKVLAVKTAAPGLIGGVVSSSQPRPLPSASLSMKPAQSFLAIGTSQAKVQVPKPGFITPMQATLTKSPHSSPILKLTPTALSPAPRTLPSMHQNSSKSPKFHSGFQGSGAFLPKASTQGNGKQPSISTPTTSANHGQRHRQVGVASALPQAAGPPLPLNFGMLGGLVPVSLPFQFPNMLNLPPSVSTATASCSTNPSSSGFTLPPSVLKSLMSGAHLQMPFSDVSQSQGGDLKRNSL